MTEHDDLASRLRTVIRHLLRHSDSLRAKGDPTRAEQAVLVTLDENGPMTPRAMADFHRVRPQTMQQTLDSLAGHRWITRADHPTDRRQLLISVSAAGRRAIQKNRGARQAWLSHEIARLPRGDRKTLRDSIAILERFLENPELKNK